MHEADNLTRLFEEEARRRMLEGQTTGGKTAGRGRPKNDDSSRLNSDESYTDEGSTRTDDQVAESVGLKRSTYRRTKAVFDTANDEKAPEPIRAVAQQQMAALDTGETTAHAAEKAGLPLTFRQFIEAPYPVGVGSTVDAVSKLVRLSHRYEAGSPERAAKLAVMREKVRVLTEKESPRMPNNGELGGGHSSFDISKLPASGQGGTSRAYNIARLKRDRPDLAALVLGGALSANAAAIEAGFRRRDTPLDTLRRAWGKASAAERAAFLHEIGARSCGDDTTADRHPPAPPPPWDDVAAGDD